MDPIGDDSHLMWRLTRGDGAALEPLIERWGDPIAETCFRALRDARLALDVAAEVVAEGYRRLRYGTARPPESFGVWAIDLIAEVLQTAADSGQIPVAARARMKLAPGDYTADELAGLEALRNPRIQRDARAALPREFSAAADRMLLQVPSLSILSSLAASGHEDAS